MAKPSPLGSTAADSHVEPAGDLLTAAGVSDGGRTGASAIAPTAMATANRPSPSAQLSRRDLWRHWQHLPASQRWSALAYKLKCAVFALPPYSWSLGGPPASTPRLPPLDPWPGDAEQGAAIISGCFTLNGQSINDPRPLWSPLGVSGAWQMELHGFGWLRDLRATGGDQARRRARELTNDWIDRHPRWSATAWAPAVTGQRLANWLGHYDFFASSSQILDRQRLLQSAARQARHLERCLPAGLTGLELLGAVKGLIYAGLCLPRRTSCLSRGLMLLRQLLAQQVLADGGHAARSPAAQLQALRDLIDLRAALHAGQAEAPPDLATAIEGMAPMLRLFQHGDGRLALFNGSNENEDWQIDLVLQRAQGPQGRKHPLQSAPQSGFQRLQAGRSLVLMDAGAPPPSGLDETAHAGTLSFEMSVGRERLIVNCGAHWGPWIWQEVQRCTAAHSTLTLAQTNSSALLRAGGLGRRRATVSCHRQEDGGNIWLESSHDGYLGTHGALHHRRLYLAATGDDLRGEDRLTLASERAGKSKKAPEFAIRFHLHPDVQATLVQGGDSALLRLPKGDTWRLQARGAALTLEPSVYLGQRGQIRRSQQVVLNGSADSGETAVKWALRRENKKR